METDPRPKEARREEPRSPDARVPARPLDEAYLEAVRWVESLECNRPHQDKSWVARVEESARQYFASLRRA